MVDKFRVVTICGSTKFKDEFIEAEKELTLQGNIVLTCGLFNHADNLNISEEQKTMLDEMHRRKIDMSDYIYVVNKDDYIGSSTGYEIAYAAMQGKEIVYKYPHKDRIIYFELNNWFGGRDYPENERFEKWVNENTFSHEEFVKENNLCVRRGNVDMSINWCITAPESWVLKNCPELLSDEKYTYQICQYYMGENKIIDYEGAYSNFLRFKEDPEDLHVYGRFDWPFLDYDPENIGKVEIYDELGDIYPDNEDDDEDEEDE